MVGLDNKARARRVSCALGASVLAIGAVLATSATAQCSPDPTQANGTTTCSGTDPDGLRVTTTPTTVNVAQGATVTAGARPAIAVDVPIPANNAGFSSTTTLNVFGAITGNGQPGVALFNGTSPTPYPYGTATLKLTVAVGGSITGTNALALSQSPGNSGGYAFVALDNAGRLTGTGGVALQANSTVLTGFTSILNRATGVITGGISGAIGTLTNAGVIDGGAQSALNTPSNNYYASQGSWTNTGTIRSASTAATIQNGYGNALTNSGTITNGGTGAAITGATLTIQNQAGGRISTAGATAINAATALTLTNLGTITGNIVAGPSSGLYGGASTIDSTGGLINGSVSFGSYDDILIARYNGTRMLVTGIAGAINGGGGNNTEQVVFASNTSVATPIDLATNFRQLGIAPTGGATVTLEQSFQTNATVVLTGTGFVINKGTIAATGQAVIGAYFGFGPAGAVNFTNQGTITGSSTQSQYGVQLAYVPNFTNSGTINIAGNGVSPSGNFVNTGSVTATGIGVFQGGGQFDNRGSITSTGGVGVRLSGPINLTATNSGTIRGATVGAETGYALTNTGTIASTAAGGTGVVIDDYGALINAAGGVVSGSGRAVGGQLYNSSVVNAGTINGNVVFTDSSSTFNNRYFAQAGGVLNGNLALGSNDTLIAEVIGTGPGQVAGIKGTVTAASGARLRLRTSVDASGVIGPVGPFAIVGYEVSNGAKLTLTAPSTVTSQLLLAGQGSIDLNATLVATSAPAILSTNQMLLPGATSATPTSLAITSRGTINVTRASTSANPGAAVSLGIADSFTNLGTINVVDRTSSPTTVGIQGTTYSPSTTGTRVVNAGAIRLDGGTAISNATFVTNTGTITQVAGGARATGVTGLTSLNNSGTINVAGAAVSGAYSSYQFGAASITNSGTLASTGGAAVTAFGTSFGYKPTITNLAGGVIRGGAGTAVQVSGATLNNAGTILGSVDLGYVLFGYSSYDAATYIASGGTVAGDVLFGSGSDLFLQTGATTGVSGVIDGGSGRDTYGRVFAGSDTFALDPAQVRNFEDRLVQAIGPDTVVTTTSSGTFTGNLYAVGTGSVINQAAIAGRLLTYLPNQMQDQFPAAQPMIAALTNTGSITGGVSGATPSFTNSGTIGSARLTTAAVSLQDNGPLSFTNTGQITGTNDYYASTVQLSGTDNVAVVNSGTIIGGLNASVIFSSAQPGVLTVANSGTLSASGAYASALSVGASSTTPDAAGSVTVNNSGTVTANSASGYAAAWIVDLEGTAAPIGYSLVNSGKVSAIASDSSPYATAFGLQLGGGAQASGTVANLAGGSITATGFRAYALVAYGTPLMLDNAGVISASGGKNPIAILTFDAFNNTVRNSGTITGDVLLAAGADRVENAGSITGNVSLAGGDDVFVQRGGTVSGLVDGGDGADLLQVDASGGGAVSATGFTNFERVQQVGTGNVAYSGAFGVGTIELAGGTLSVAAGQQLSTTGPTTITGTGGGVSINNAGTIAGGITLGDSGDSVTNTGTIGGPVQLGGGADSFRMTSGAMLGGIVDGGAGYDSLTLALATDTVLRPGVFRNFEALSTEGASTLMLAGGAFNFDKVSAQGNLAVASDASLAATVAFGAGDNRFLVAGGFTGSVDGGAGNDTIEVTGGAQAAPVAFGSIGNVEAYRQTGGFATLAGTGNVGAMYLGGGRFVGLGGSTLTASQIGVDTGAIFGSAGVVNGNLAVAGTLSPGATVGTMTVNGNVSLLAGSTSLFELTPAASDKLVVNGTVGIAPGATLQLAGTGTGNTIDLITASGGVSGAFTTLSKPAALNGFLSYQATRVQFVTAFAGDASFSPQAARALAYTNGVLSSGQASAALLAGLPRLMTATGAASAAAFNRITPEAYATAQQIGVESGLALSESARGFAAPTDRAGLFTFGELQGDWTRLPGNGATGASRAEASAQGLLGGVGIGTGAFSVGAFAGYRWTNQRIAALDARTRHDGTVAGVQARVAAGGFALVATGAYDGGDAVTTRAVPDGIARARYGLHGWTGDVSASYALTMGANWRLTPHVGGTVIHDIRDAVTETGGSGFALNVARGRERASFVDGGVGIEGGTGAGARFHPFASLGARWQLEGREPTAVAGFGGGATTLLAYGARRAEVVGTGTLGFAADVAGRVSLFASATGEAARGEHRIAARAGLRARF